MIQHRHVLRAIAGLAGAVALSAMMLPGIGSPAQAATTHTSTIAINGAGSTFVAPLLIGKWVPGYQSKYSNVRINYNATGSGTGISLWTAGTTDFAASDALLSSDQETAAKTRCGSNVTKLPATIGAVALIYNLPGVQTGLKLTPDIVARIFLGDIHEWSDQRIKRLNPGVNLPARPIQLVHRSDGSGTSYITTHYLAAVSSTWSSKVGSGSTVNWPVGLGAKGSSGVAALVGRAQGAIGYVDLAYAIQNSLNYASVQNKAGKYIAPGVDSASAAAASFASSMPHDLQQTIVNSSAAAAYPISGYSYIFLCSTQRGDKGKTLVDFAKYAVTTGQSASKSLYYAPLPSNVQSKDVAALKAITVK